MTKTKENNMWGGRFTAGPSAIMEAINASIEIDQRLWREDIEGSKAHAAMLVEQHIISDEDGQAIQSGLDTIAHEIETGQFQFSTALEDIHMNIEARLAELIGEAAGRLHTARSRNDQVATDFRLWCRKAAVQAAQAITELQTALMRQAATHAATVMPGFTHLQTAQPVTFGHHCLAYVEMLERDKSRFADCAQRLNQCPLGAAALAGTSFQVNRDKTASVLGFSRPCRNSLDAVSARDFALELVSTTSICSIHLSRLAEEIILWSSSQFAFITLPDEYSTGSSIMPQKKNPDAAELIRAKAGRIIGDLNSLMVMMKALPLTYSKDMQEDKERSFDAIDTLALSLAALTGMVSGLTVHADAMKKAARLGYSTATDLADWLVRIGNIPFRQAHHITGRLVALAEQQGCDLADLSLKQMQDVDPCITDDIFSVLTVEHSVASRTSFGGTAPEQVSRQIAYWQDRLTR
ncbi:MAG: argininosuccinate lyase [bacterium]